jgi:hypothetical protein
MTDRDRDWHDDSDYDEAVRKAERMTRFGWRAIAGVSGAIGLVAVVAAVALLVAALVVGYAVAAVTD